MWKNEINMKKKIKKKCEKSEKKVKKNVKKVWNLNNFLHIISCLRNMFFICDSLLAKKGAWMWHETRKITKKI